MNIKQFFILGPIAAVAILTGCAQQGPSGSNYARGQVGAEQSVRNGRVENVREVLISANDSGVGTVAGAALGGVAGSTLGGSSRANTAGAIAGVIVGGLIGNAVEKSNNDRKGVEVTIRLENGQLIAITQEKDEEFRVGDQVRILSGQGTTRVTRF